MKYQSNTQTIDESFFRKIAMGQVPGWFSVRKFGSGVVTTTLTTVWSGASLQSGLYIYPSDDGEVMTIESSSTSDMVGGVGATYCIVEGLAPGLSDFQDEIVALNGTTPVTLTKSFSRIFRIRVIDTGDPLRNTGNIGNIQVKNLAGTIIYGVITDSGRSPSQTQMALWTLPLGYTGYYASTAVSTNGARATSIYVYSRAKTDFIPGFNPPFQSKAEIKTRSNIYEEPLLVWEQVPGGTDIEVRADTADQSGTDNVAGQFYVIYSKDTP